MSRFRLTRRAEETIIEIFAFGCEQFGEAQAEAYGDGMIHVFALLADNPRMGRAADQIAYGVRRHEYRSHVILYEERTRRRAHSCRRPWQKRAPAVSVTMGLRAPVSCDGRTVGSGRVWTACER